MINFRDISTQESNSGARIREGILFRSAGPLYEGDHPSLNLVQTWIDLRTSDEVERANSDRFPKRISVPLRIGDDEFHSVPVPKPSDWTALYERATERLMPEWIQIAKLVLTESKPILISCTAGKDRTGMAVALLLYLVGVDKSVIIRDYGKTSDMASELSQKHLPALRAKGISDPEITDAYFMARPEIMEGLLAHWDKRRHWIYAEFSRRGFGSSEMESLRLCLVES